MKKLLLAVVGILILNSCYTSKVAVKESNRIDVAIDLNNVVNDKVQVTVNPQKLKETTVVYQIPAIVPGTYVISDYGKFISDFKAYDYDGNEMSVEQLDTNSWQVNNAQQLDKFTYWVEDTFDTEKKHSVYVMAGTNIEEGENFFLNLPGFVGYLKGKKESPYQISISHPEKLYETSSLINKNTTKEDNTKDVFVASRYDEISDNPIMYAPLNSVSFNVDEIDVTLAVYSPNNKHAAKDMESDLKKMVQAQSNFLKGFKTTNEYNILLYLFDSKVYNWTNFGALEHLSSTTVVYPEKYSKEQLANGMINGTVSHEFFHIVTPLSVHSKEIHSFDFNKPNMSQHLWMYEGITEYFANLFQVNQGLIDEQEFIDAMKGKIDISLRYNDSMSFTTMSKNILEDKYAKNYGNVYQKGALIGMSLDIILRNQSDGKYGVRNLMKDLSEKYGKNKPFDDNEIIGVITEMTYPAVGEFFNKHVTGNTPINYSELFEMVGVKKGEVEKETNYVFAGGQNIIFKADKDKGEIWFSNVALQNSFWKSQGIKAGDVLMKVNGEEVTLANANKIVSEMFSWKEGQEVTVEIERSGKPMTIKTKLTKPTAITEALVIDKNATQAQKDLREAWLKG